MTNMLEYRGYLVVVGPTAARSYCGWPPTCTAAQAQAAGVSLKQWIAGRLEQVLATPHRSAGSQPFRP